MSARRKTPDERAEAFTAAFPVGRDVHYFPIAGEPEFRRTRIRSIAWPLGDGSIVVKVEGIAGGVHVDHVRAACGVCRGSGADPLSDNGNNSLPCKACNGTGRS